MWKKFPPTDWRSIDPLAFNYFSTLLQSRVNIFLYGMNGIGKTKFAKKCLDVNNIQYCYVDCFEYYNEKLICYTISSQLGLMDKYIKDSKTFVALKDNLLTWKEDEIKIKSISSKYKKRPIYIVLDNVERIISIERVKKNLEKIFIVADMVCPLLSILIIHDTYIEEIDAFNKSLFNEYNFTPFVLNPMDQESMRAVLKEKYFSGENNDGEKDKFDPFFKYLYSQLSKQTVNLKKWLFMTKLMFESYCDFQHKRNGMNLSRFTRILKHVCTHFYSNVIDIKSIEEEIEREKEEENQRKAEDIQKVDAHLDQESKPIFRPHKVTFFEEMRQGNKTSYTFVEAMILLSGLLAAHNKESNDEANFGLIRPTKKKTNRKVKQTTDIGKITYLELGKTKKFSMERMLTIFQYFLSYFCDTSEEAKMYHHSINVYSKINTFVSENLFKRSQGRNEDPSAISLKINYDKHFVEEVLKQFPEIKLSEHLEGR
ncbi:unnamed protein product [Moneuplotes crassus]|uniref:Origin recognition complex subunit 5 C-terminal domain-containing protein n=1 Tax=Euplotes crassus TaxID=5936 RepID=A0AAD1UIZ5_EUPCR|nr:unnamed protein product [Moneuplotes crassus]